MPRRPPRRMRSRRRTSRLARASSSGVTSRRFGRSNSRAFFQTMSESLEPRLAQFRSTFRRIQQEMGKMIVGQDDVIESVLVALFAGGHVLLEGVPGLGKTMLVRTLGEAVNLQFHRIQFTPDLLPADIVRTNIIHQDEHGRRSLQFCAG